MSQTTVILNQVLPILLLLALGRSLRALKFLSPGTVEELKKLVVFLALPSVLFLSFLSVELKSAYVVLFLLVFALCCGLLGLGVLLKPSLGRGEASFPFMLTGFEYGMLGISLFGGAYGLDKIGYIAVVDLGHEFFIWFVFVFFLLLKRDGRKGAGEVVRGFASSPVILGICAGLLLNLLGLGGGPGSPSPLHSLPVLGAVMAGLGFISQLTVPLILLIVGYGIHIEKQGLARAAGVVALRMALMIGLALLLNRLVIRQWLELGRPFEIALFTLLILPPPFITPLFMRPDAKHDLRYVNNVLAVGAVATILVFTISLILNPSL